MIIDKSAPKVPRRSSSTLVTHGSSRLECITESIHRISSSCVGDVQLSIQEHRILQRHILNGLSITASKYLCWRKSMLQAMTVPFFFSSMLKSYDLWNDSQWDVFTAKLQGYLPFIDKINEYNFEAFFYLHIFQNFVYFLVIVFAAVGIASGIKMWSSYTTSKKYVRAGFLVSFILPFTLLILIPFRQSVDYENLKKELCQHQIDVLNITSKACDLPSRQWASTVMQELESEGFLKDSITNTCKNAVKVYNNMQGNRRSLQSVNEVDESIKQKCESGKCAACVQNDTCVKMAAAYLYGQIEEGDCATCYESDEENLQGMSCMQICSYLVMPRLLSNSAKYCADEAFLEHLEFLGRMASDVDYAQFLIGAFVGITSLQTLFPASISLMFGALRGARVSKALSSYSRIPGYTMAAAIILCIPTIITVIVSIQQVFGDLWSLFGLVSFICNVLIWLPLGSIQNKRNVGGGDPLVGLVLPQTFHSVRMEMKRRSLIALYFKVISFVCILVFFLQSDLGSIFHNYFISSNSRVLLFQLSRSISLFSLDLIGRSMFSAVVFSDAFVDIVVEATIGDYRDSCQIQGLRYEQAAQVDTLTAFTKPKSTKVKGPEASLDVKVLDP